MSSRLALSEPLEQMIEVTRAASWRRRGWRSTMRVTRSRPMACTQATLPRMVAISPLCARPQNGWARRHELVVLVE
jgi:hypothetical protein